MSDTPKPSIETEVIEETETITIHLPKYNIVLLDDNDHSYEYVVEMLMKLFGHSERKAFDMTHTVDKRGRVVVDTAHKERAELKRDQIHAYGADWRIPSSAGSMSAKVEPAE